MQCSENCAKIVQDWRLEKAYEKTLRAPIKSGESLSLPPEIVNYLKASSHRRLSI